jgi:hypothetical protein
MERYYRKVVERSPLSGPHAVEDDPFPYHPRPHAVGDDSWQRFRKRRLTVILR